MLKEKGANGIIKCLIKTRAKKYMRQKLLELQGEIDKSTIILGDFTTLLSGMDRSSRRKIVRIQLNSTAPSTNWI